MDAVQSEPASTPNFLPSKIGLQNLKGIGPALSIAAIGSFFAGCVSTVLVRLPPWHT